MAELPAVGHDLPATDSSRHAYPLLKFEISDPETINEAITTPDLTQDGSGHAVNLVRIAVEEQLRQRGFPNRQLVRGSRIVSVEDNFDRLRFPKDSASRSSTYTRYVSPTHVLQTHISAQIPSTLDELAKQPDVEDVTFIVPGLVYRRDVSDRTHLGIFHQMDVWHIQKNNGRLPLDTRDLGKLVTTVFAAAVPGYEPIIYPAVRSYTEQGIGVYARFGDGSEIEVLKAGLAHPEILRASDLDPNEYSGLALGMGIDRLVMARKGLSDIRFLRANNPKVASQMYDLRPYEEVSSQPVIVRDLSYVVPADAATPEDISEGLRQAFGSEAYLIEEISIRATTPPEELHPNAIARLCIGTGQVNVLVSVALRHPDHTLTRQEINEHYAQIYPQIHHGSGPGYI